MAYVPATSTRVLLGSYALSANLTGVEAGPSVAMLDTTTIVDTAETFIPGLKDEMFSLQGWLDPTGTANLQYDQLKTWTELGAGEPLTVSLRGIAAGGVEVLMANALAAKLDIGTPVAGVVNFKMDAQQDGAVDLGKMLQTTVPTTATRNENSTDWTAASANGLVAHLHVLAYSGLTNVVIKVQHSTDDSSWSDLITFSTVSGLTYQRSSVTGSVSRYTRVISTVTGTGSISYYVAVARR